MKKIIPLLTFILLASNFLSAQKTHQKILVLNFPSIGHKDGLHEKIEVFPFFITDSTSNEKLIAAYDSLGRDMRGIYALAEKDSSKYLATIQGGVSFSRYVVQRYDLNGNYVSVSQYNLKHQEVRREIMYYPGMRFKSIGSYSNGKKRGTWRYYDEQGKMIKKEIYRKGELKKSKTIAHPHRTYLTLVSPKDYTPIPYKILDVKDTSKVVFPSDTIAAKHFPIGFSLGMNFVQSDFKNLRTLPWMLNSPIDQNFGFGEEIHIGSREKFFITSGLYYGTSAFRGIYDTLGNINVNAIYFRYNAIANVPFYKGKHYGLFLNAGITYAHASITSLQHITGTNPNGTTIYFEDSQIKQTLISAGISYDYSRHPNNPNYATYLTVKAGYNFTLADPQWKSSTPLYPEPKISLGGFYAGVSFTIWRARRK